MRKKIVAGNWKMNKSYAEALELTNNLLASNYNNSVQLIIIPPSLYIADLVNATDGTNMEVGAQNCSQFESGAYTGELSAKMIFSVGATHAIIGHSERRQYFNEQNKDLALKIDQLLKWDLTPIYCCGEKLNERETKNHFNVVRDQIEEGMFHLSESQISKCVIAYEPVWAIGTGVTASSDQAQEMHQFIRSLLKEKYGSAIADSISILYGGSCNPSNAKELFSNPDVDGGLIGGASLIAKDFISIANSF